MKMTFIYLIPLLLFVGCQQITTDDSFDGFTVTVDNRSTRVMEVYMNDVYQGIVNGESKTYIEVLETGTYILRAVTISTLNFGSTTHASYDISSDIVWTIYPI